MKAVILLIAVELAIGVALLTMRDASAAGTDLTGNGALSARGSGHAVVEGDGSVTVHGFGHGQVVVCGAEHIEARGDGRRVNRRDGCAVFHGYKSTIHAGGDDMKVAIEGRRVSFTAEGQGHAFLKGSGTFKVGELSGRWTKDGVRVHYSS